LRAYSSICRFSAGTTRRFSDSRRTPSATTTMRPECNTSERRERGFSRRLEAPGESTQL
jgi:hypothetical protein